MIIDIIDIAQMYENKLKYTVKPSFTLAVAHSNEGPESCLHKISIELKQDLHN